MYLLVGIKVIMDKKKQAQIFKKQ